MSREVTYAYNMQHLVWRAFIFTVLFFFVCENFEIQDLNVPLILVRQIWLPVE